MVFSPRIEVWFSIQNSVNVMPNMGFPCGSAGKESACSAGDLDLIPGLGRSPGEGKGYPLQYSGLENSMVSRELDMTEWLSLSLSMPNINRLREKNNCMIILIDAEKHLTQCSTHFWFQNSQKTKSRGEHSLLGKDHLKNYTANTICKLNWNPGYCPSKEINL